MSKTYRKVHNSEKAEKNHLSKIRGRGGKATTSKKGRKFVIDYEFPDKTIKRSKSKYR